MKKFGIAAILATGLSAAALGIAGPAVADVGHHDWVVNTTHQSANPPQTDTTVHQSR